MKQLLTLALVFWAGLVLAQKTVTGTILDEGGDGLIGASVIIPGTTTGTVTDFDGAFTLEVPDGTTELQVSYVGFQTIMVDVTGDTKNMTINMYGGELLDEIYVVGYGTQRKREITGSVTSIKSEQIEKVANSNVVQGLTGKVPGVKSFNKPDSPVKDLQFALEE